MKFAPKCSFCLATISILFVGAWRLQRTQDTYAQEVIKVQTAEVLIDAIVTDHHNKLVNDLTADDFVVYEDGVPQKVVGFRVSRGTAPVAKKLEASATAKEVAPSTPAGVAELGEPPAYTILLLDYSTVTITNQKYVKDAATNYIKDKLQPNERLAIFLMGSGLRPLTDFTNDKDKLVAAVQSNTDVRGTAIAGERESLNSQIGAGDASATTTVGSPSVGAGASAASTGQGMSGASAAAEAMAMSRIQAQYQSLLSALDREQTRQVLLAIRAIALGVKQIPGRKNLLLVSQGFVIQTQLWGQLQSVVDAANKSQVAIYSLDPSGLQTRGLSGAARQRDEFTSSIGASENERNNLGSESRIKATGGENVFDRVSQVGHDQPESALRYISGSTGGFLIHNTNDLTAGLARVSEEMRTYYQLTYHSTNQNMDGKFRQIRVELRVPRLTVRSRAGYYAVPAGYDLLSPHEYEIVAKAQTAQPEARIPLFLRAAAFRKTGLDYTVPLVFEVPTPMLQFEKQGEAREASLSVIGIVRNSKGEVVSRFGSPTKLQYTPAEFEAIKDAYVSFMEVQSLRAGGAYTFEVYVSDENTHKVAQAQRALVLNQPDQTLGLSTLLLAHGAQKAQTNQLDFLTYNGVRIRPSAHCQFHNGDNLLFYMDVYNPRPAQDQKSDLEVNVFVMKGAAPSMKLPPYHLTEAVADQPKHVTLARYMKLAGLPAGDYSLLVSIRDVVAGGEERTTQAQFSVAD